MKQSTSQLLSIFVWGKVPENIDEITETLNNRNVDLNSVTKEVDAIIKKHSGTDTTHGG
jgi:hypothetical protein